MTIIIKKKDYQYHYDYYDLTDLLGGETKIVIAECAENIKLAEVPLQLFLYLTRREMS